MGEGEILIFHITINRLVFDCLSQPMDTSCTHCIFFLSKHEKKDWVSLYCISHITFIHVEGFVNAQGCVQGGGSKTNKK